MKKQKNEMIYQGCSSAARRRGIDRNHCGLGVTEHPFTIEFSRYDVRITTNYKREDLCSSLFSVIHEESVRIQNVVLWEKEK